MNQVEIKKDVLIARIQTNRDGHRAEYETAIEGYRKTVIDWFNEQVDKAKAGKPFEVAFVMPKPEDHTKDYDRILDMLDLAEEDVINLGQGEFQQYVRDEWGWQVGTKEIFASYSA